MGTALLEGWLAKLSDDLRFIIIDPMITPDHPCAKDGRVEIMTSPDAYPKNSPPDIIVLAMKPQTLAEAMPPLVKLAAKNTAWLSIVAGVTIAKMTSYIEAEGGLSETAIIRTMPNTPAAIGQGITAMIMNAHVDGDLAKQAVDMMGVVGDVVMLDHEDEMDIVTAVSGSGPAYVFLMREALEAAGISAGLKPDLAEQLAAATISGAVELMNQSSESPSQLRLNVTSPAGTTQAAMDVLMAEDGLMAIMKKAVLAARERSSELGK